VLIVEESEAIKERSDSAGLSGLIARCRLQADATGSVIQLLLARVIGTLVNARFEKVIYAAELDGPLGPLFRGYSPAEPVFIVHPPNVTRSSALTLFANFTRACFRDLSLSFSLSPPLPLFPLRRVRFALPSRIARYDQRLFSGRIITSTACDRARFRR